MENRLSEADQTFVLGLTYVISQFPDEGHIVVTASEPAAEVALHSTGNGGIELRATLGATLSEPERDTMRSLGWADPDRQIPYWQQFARHDESDRHINQVAAIIYATFAMVGHSRSDRLSYRAWIGEPGHPVTISALGLPRAD